MTQFLLGMRDGARTQWMTDDETSSGMDDSYSLELADEWTNWRVDDPELESDETTEEGST